MKNRLQIDDGGSSFVLLFLNKLPNSNQCIYTFCHLLLVLFFPNQNRIYFCILNPVEIFSHQNELKNILLSIFQAQKRPAPFWIVSRPYVKRCRQYLVTISRTASPITFGGVTSDLINLANLVFVVFARFTSTGKNDLSAVWF